MARGQIALFLNEEKHSHSVSEFKKAVTEIEGQYNTHLGDYICEALDFYRNYLLNFPEKIGKEKHTISNLSKIQKIVNKFIDHLGESVKVINNQGLDHHGFSRLLAGCFKVCDKTLGTYEKYVLTQTNWRIINIPSCNKKLVLSFDSDLYQLVQRFDLTNGNYYNGLKPNQEENKVFKEIRAKLLPKAPKQEIENIAEKEADEFFGGIKQ